MAVSVEATLVSKYSDGVSKQVEATRQMIQNNMAAMTQASQALGGSMEAAFGGALSQAENLRQHLLKLSTESNSNFKAISLAVAAMSIAVVAGFLAAGKAVASFLLNMAKEASDVLELKMAYEGLSKSVGWHESTLKSLRHETEGLIGSTDLLKNANRVMASGVKITSDQYVELVGNVFRLAKAAHVDGAQAINILTDALIRGNARGFQTVGIAINVKDAISEMAAASGQSTNTLENTAKRQAFYNELLQQTSAAVAKLPADYISIKDALERGELAWKGWFSAVGQAAGRSAVLQELLKKMAEWLWKIEDSRGGLEQTTVVINGLILSLLNGAATLAQLASYVGYLLSPFWAGVKTLAEGILATLGALYTGAAGIIGRIIGLFTYLPGRAGQAAKEWQAEMRMLRDQAAEFTRLSGSGFLNSFGGMGDTSSKLASFANSTRALAAEMAKYANEVVKGAAGTATLGGNAGGAALSQEKLNEQLKLHAELMRDLNKGFSATLGTYDDYFTKLQKINADSVASEAQKEQMRRMLVKETAEKLLKIEQDKNNKIVEQLEERLKMEKLVQDAAADVTKLKGPQIGSTPKNIADDPGYIAIRKAEQARNAAWKAIQEEISKTVAARTPTWIKPLIEAHKELLKLNTANLGPFHLILDTLRDHLSEVAKGMSDAWAGMFFDLASGQENAGKRLLANMVGMIGKIIMQAGTMLMSLGIAEIFAAMTMTGRAAGANMGAGFAALAKGAALAAIGGAMAGAASAALQSSSASSSSTSSSSTSSSSTSSSSTKILNVGASGRAQNPGEVQERRHTIDLNLTLAAPEGFIVKAVKKNITGNGELRLLLQQG
jgi:hypothetical protein